MSRSRRKSPCLQHTLKTSEKKDKKRANHILRTRNKVRIRVGLNPLHIREVSDIWDFAKDGKYWYGEEMKKSWRRK